MKIFSKAMLGLGLLMGSGVCAMADTIWTLNDIDFTDGNTATGWFITDPSTSIIESFSIVVSGPDSATDFTANVMSSAYLPNEIGAALDPGFSPYMDLYLASALTSAGGTVDITSGYDCPLCGVLIVNSDHRASVTGVAETPEPSTIPFLGAGVILLGFVARRKLVRAS
jgi:hypothetical protein